MSYNLEKSCPCGYSTFKRSNWSTHQKRCKLIESSDKELINALKQQLEAKDQQMKEQLAAKDEQIKQKDVQIKELIQTANNEILSLRKSQAAKNRRTKLPEPKRRKIAARQDWKCVNPDGNCTLKGELQEYDVDHIIPLMKGGLDNESNMQALCPACHRRKTETDVHTIST